MNTAVARLISALIDGVILWVVNLVVGLVLGMAGSAGAALAGIVSLVIVVGYFVYFWTTSGQTIGKKVMGLKVVAAGGGKIDVVKAILRYVGYIVSAFVLLLGFIWILIDKNGQGWHDKIAGTKVVKA